MPTTKETTPKNANQVGARLIRTRCARRSLSPVFMLSAMRQSYHSEMSGREGFLIGRHATAICEHAHGPVRLLHLTGNGATSRTVFVAHRPIPPVRPRELKKLSRAGITTTTPPAIGHAPER